MDPTLHEMARKTTYTMPLGPIDIPELHQKSALVQQRKIRQLLDKLDPTSFQKPPRKRARKVHPKVLGPLQADTPDQTSRLLHLPVELRLMIWELVMTTETGKLHYDAEENGFTVVGSHRSWRWEVPGLLMTCHQVALDALWLYLKVNSVVFPWPADEMQFARLLYLKEAAQGWEIDFSEWRLENGNSWFEN
jgi:hypothetical protein